MKWVSDRSEGFISDAHGRDHVSEAELALDENGKFLGLQGRDHRQHGRLSLDVRAEHPDQSLRAAARRRLHDAAIYCEVKGVFTNTCRWTPIAAPAVPRRPSCWSGSSTSRPRDGNRQGRDPPLATYSEGRLSLSDAGDRAI